MWVKTKHLHLYYSQQIVETLTHQRHIGILRITWISETSPLLVFKLWRGGIRCLLLTQSECELSHKALFIQQVSKLVSVIQKVIQAQWDMRESGCWKLKKEKRNFREPPSEWVLRTPQITLLYTWKKKARQRLWNPLFRNVTHISGDPVLQLLSLMLKLPRLSLLVTLSSRGPLCSRRHTEVVAFCSSWERCSMLLYTYREAQSGR